MIAFVAGVLVGIFIGGILMVVLAGILAVLGSSEPAEWS